jgi:hypothetical protein
MKLAAFSLAQLEVEGYGTFVSAPGLKLDRIAFVEILELRPRRKAAAMEKDVVAAVVGNDESKALIPDNFLYCSGHLRYSLLSIPDLESPTPFSRSLQGLAKHGRLHRS